MSPLRRLAPFLLGGFLVVGVLVSALQSLSSQVAQLQRRVARLASELGHPNDDMNEKMFARLLAESAREQRCLAEISASMPIDAQGNMRVHQGEATNPPYSPPKWNELARWNPLPNRTGPLGRSSMLSPPCLFWYVGGNVAGYDGIRLQTQYPCHMHVFEPVPSFFAKLQKRYATVPRSELHAFGLGKAERVVPDVPVRGQSTFTMDTSNDKGDTIEQTTGHESIRIRSVGAVYEELQQAAGTRGGRSAEPVAAAAEPPTPQRQGGNDDATVALLHMNCEGCEWEVLEALVDSGVAARFDTIQVGFHLFPSIAVGIKERYCRLATALSRTHDLVFRSFFAWERWQRKAH